MNIRTANIEAFVAVLKAAGLTAIPAAQIYKDEENLVAQQNETVVTSKRVIPCIIVTCDDANEAIAYTGQYMSRPVVEVHCSADDKTDTEFSAILEEVSNVFFDQTQPAGTPINPEFLPGLLSSSLDNFTSQYARLIGQGSRVQDRRWVGAFKFEILSCQADL